MARTKEKFIVAIGTLVLIGVFTAVYFGINAFAFTDVATDIPLQQPVVTHNGPRITETADDNLGLETSHFNVNRLASQQAHYLTRAEAEVVVAEILYEQTGLVVDMSDLIFGLLDQYPNVQRSMWITSTREYDVNGQTHDIHIDAITGEVIRFDSNQITVDYLRTITHGGTTFTIVAQGCPFNGPRNSNYLQPYMLTQVETAAIAADFIAENFGITMDGLRMQVIFGHNGRNMNNRNNSYWTVWVTDHNNLSGGQRCQSNGQGRNQGGGCDSNTLLFNLMINATTGEIVNYHDYRQSNTQNDRPLCLTIESCRSLIN